MRRNNYFYFKYFLYSRKQMHRDTLNIIEMYNIPITNAYIS